MPTLGKNKYVECHYEPEINQLVVKLVDLPRDMSSPGGRSVSNTNRLIPEASIAAQICLDLKLAVDGLETSVTGADLIGLRSSRALPDRNMCDLTRFNAKYH